MISGRAILPILVIVAGFCLVRYSDETGTRFYAMISSGEVGIPEKEPKRYEIGGTEDSKGKAVRGGTTNKNGDMENRNAQNGKPVNSASETGSKGEGRRGPTPKPAQKTVQQSPTPKRKQNPKPKPSRPPSRAPTTPTKKPLANIKSASEPQIAWLMSFPNSGTSYTSKLVRTITNSSTATNYGASTRDEYGCSRPIADKYAETGPFWQSNTYSQLGGQNGEYLLTKTHCGGYCNGCGPSQYFETLATFQEGCLTGKRSNRCRRDVNGERIMNSKAKTSYDVVQYNASLVRRAVHVIRNPFDNVVSRFHLKAKELRARNRENYDNSKEGFRRWCAYIDGSFVEQEAALKAFSSRRKLLDRIPCHADFVRYLLWHHYAERTQSSLNIPTLVLHYEEYYASFNATVDTLMAFLYIEGTKNSPEKFEIGKTYRDYFTSSEKEAVAELAESISSNITWQRLERYF